VRLHSVKQHFQPSYDDLWSLYIKSMSWNSALRSKSFL